MPKSYKGLRIGDKYIKTDGTLVSIVKVLKDGEYCRITVNILNTYSKYDFHYNYTDFRRLFKKLNNIGKLLYD